ncbi:ATP-dependent nuclease [Abyssalbus ytuae]|uniref:AAA family ATPase n=1 Tax=Abyssalbus ytuae TaxID=2926907 RepID=A0A9E6ZTH0_9FLAO|nr:AAA family ATPase [Abyssalbus ytuae]UOB17518.1 AAA family ATPase [Abyssalbus ytuae]
MKSPFISRVKIKNFRNFLDVDVKLNHKQVIIGENSIGKTNFLRAIQIILDKGFTDYNRQLDSSDFHDSLVDPMENGEEITITIEIRNYEHNRQLVAQFEDAVVSTEPPTLQLNYKYYPIKDENELILRYQYVIYKGINEEKHFKHDDRSLLNIKVIGALRDVERELNSNRNSPLYKLVKQYDIDQDELIDISEEMRSAADEILNLDEIRDIKKIIEEKFSTLAGLQRDNTVNLRPYDIDIERLLYTIQVFMGLKERPVSELSLGLANILYVSLMMLLLKDRTVPRIIKNEDYQGLIDKDDGEIMTECYDISTSEINYIIKDDINLDTQKKLYAFFDKNNYQPHTITILALEEPEAHLHPVLQRLIYREVLHKSENSVIFTTHSPYITAISPLESIVHGRYEDEQTKMFSTSDLKLEQKEKEDIERYLDAKKGEIYFGKGVLLVEGITEEYIIPKVAELMGTSLDDLGIIVCNIHSTNFKPYVQILNSLKIPWCLITDGDFYELEIQDDNGKEKKKKHYHRNWEEGKPQNFRGLELMNKMLVDLEIIKDEDIPSTNFSEQFDLLSENGCFVGFYTFEVDSMHVTNEEGLETFKKVYSEVRTGGEKEQENFNTELDNKNFWNGLKKIDNNISKGRFAQRLSAHLTIEMVPDYIINAINEIIKKVKNIHE